jgi:hypothetical protein
MSLSGGGANSTNGPPPMTTLTMRFMKGDFIITGIAPMKFKSRREAKQWCANHYHASSITEIGADRSKRVVVAAKGRPNPAVARLPGPSDRSV